MENVVYSQTASQGFDDRFGFRAQWLHYYSSFNPAPEKVKHSSIVPALLG